MYEVTCKHAVDEAQLQKLLSGVVLVDAPNETIQALACKRISDKVIHLTLGEGKYHQVKRMLAAVSNRVEQLHRIRIGQLHLPNDLHAGEWRWLSEADMILLRPDSASS